MYSPFFITGEQGLELEQEQEQEQERSRRRSRSRSRSKIVMWSECRKVALKVV